jgi:hypothetical protein
MKTIVETLETQHVALGEGVTAVEAALKSGTLDEVRLNLTKLCEMLEAHLHLENTQFYPDFVRRADASPNTNIGMVVRLFQQNMTVIADGTLAFCRRFEAEIPDRAAFKKEWRTALAVLAQRMVDEEQTLHPLYAKL